MAFDSNDCMDWQDDIDSLSVHVTDIVVATPESADLPQHEPVRALLERIRTALGLYVVFVAQSVDNQPSVRLASGCDEFDSDPLEEAYGRRVLESRPPTLRKRASFPVFHVLPVIGKESCEYGTLVCRGLSSSGAWGNSNDRDMLRSVSRLIANTLEDVESTDSLFGTPLAMSGAQPEFALAA